MNSIFEEFFKTLRDDSTLQGLVGGTDRFHRSWPLQVVAYTTSDPAAVIVSLQSGGGRSEANGMAFAPLTFAVHVFVMHDGKGQAALLAIRDRIEALLNRKSFTALSDYRALDTVNVGEELDLYEEERRLHHGVLTYEVGPVYQVTTT